jgi:hypothetical protein
VGTVALPIFSPVLVTARSGAGMPVIVRHGSVATLHPEEITAMTDIDPDLRALLLKTIQVQQKGALVAWHPALTLEKKYNGQYILK